MNEFRFKAGGEEGGRWEESGRERMQTDQKLNMSLDELVGSERGTKRVYSSVESPNTGVKTAQAAGGGGGGGGSAGGGGASSGEPGVAAQNAVDGGKGIVVAKRVYVGNLSWRTSWQGLKDHFRSVGNVVYADVMRDSHDPSRSKGCGVVEFERPEEALLAIQTMNDVELDGRPLFIREDREDRDLGGSGNTRGPNRGGGGGPHMGARRGPPHVPGGGGFNKRTKVNGGVGVVVGGGGGTITVGRRLYVANISWETSWQDLKDHFRQAGNVVYSDIMQDPTTGRSKGCGIVEFEKPEEALRAISQLSNSDLHGRPLLVREDREDKETNANMAGGGAGAGVMHMHAPPFVGNQHGAVMHMNGAASAAGRQIVVQNLPWNITWQELKDSFRQSGNVVRADVMLDDQGRSKGFGTVLFEQPHEATAAIQMFNEQDFGGRIVSVRMDKVRCTAMIGVAIRMMSQYMKPVHLSFDLSSLCGVRC